MYVGLRPGVAYRFGSEDLGFLLGVWGYARWDVTEGNVPVTAGGGIPSQGEVELAVSSVDEAIFASVPAIHVPRSTSIGVRPVASSPDTWDVRCMTWL